MLGQYVDIITRHVLFIAPNVYRPDLPNFCRKYHHLPPYIKGDIIATSDEKYNGMKIGNTTLHVISDPTKDWKKAITTVIRTVKTAVKINREKKIDIIHVYDPLTLGIAGIVGKKLTGARLITEINGHLLTAAFLRGSRLRNKMRKWIYRQIIRLCFAQSDRIKFINQELVGEFQREIRFDEKKVVIFHDHVATDYFGKSETDENFIFFAGFPFFLKGVDILIQAFKRLADDFPEYRLLIMGYNDVDLDDYRRMAESCERIEFLPPRHYDEIRPYFQNCSFFVLPSRSEGMGKVIIEAMASGKAVIGSRVGGIPEFVDHGNTGFLFESENAVELELRMRELLTDRELRQRMGAAGFRRVEREFSESVYAAKMAALLQSVCS